MPLANVMVHVDLDPPRDARLSVARDLAVRFGAGVIGIAACGPPPGASTPGGFGIALALVERDRRQAEAHLGEAEQAFRAAMAGLASPVAWRAACANPAAYVAQQARSADLVIVGANRDRLLAPPVDMLDPAELVLSAGRPLLLVPSDVKEFVGARAVVAWKDVREARRAVADALPLLQRAEDVIVVEVGEGGAGGHALAGEADVAAWLQRHGVNARAIVTDGASAVAAQLEKIAEEQGADLIVAGAYGHGRFREWALGGVTRDLLLHARRCVLLSH